MDPSAPWSRRCTRRAPWCWPTWPRARSPRRTSSRWSRTRWRTAAGGSSSGRRAPSSSPAWSPRTSRTRCWSGTAAGRCARCAAAGDPHALEVEPELGPDPHWVCHKAGVKVAAVGALGAGRRALVTVLHRPAHLAGPRPHVVPPGQRRLLRRTARLRRRGWACPPPRLRARPLRHPVAPVRGRGARRARWRSAAARWCGCCTGRDCAGAKRAVTAAGRCRDAQPRDSS